jgi:alanine racemase
MAFIHINKQHFYHNLNKIALQTGSVEKVAIVLKDNAYGHGLELMAKLASEFGITQAVVRSTKEAEKIKTYFSHILILGDSIIKHDTYTYAINTISDIKEAQQGANIELKVDTGMHRNGIAIDEVDEALAIIEEKKLKLVGVMTHYRSADELSSEFFWQQKNFERVKEHIKVTGFTNVRFHSHNSASILRNKNFDEDLVRVGIGAYGYNELPDIFDKIELKPVLSLYAHKISTRVLTKGQRVGYGGDFKAERNMKISTYDIGYGDGWQRGTYVTAENLPVLGRVSMDFITLETEKETICMMDDAQKAAKQLKTISYEITTALHADIERKMI